MVAMRRRMWVVTSCVIGLTLVAPAAGSERAVVPKDGLYKGKSGQGQAVKFRVRGRTIRGDARFTVTGSGGCKWTLSYVFPAVKIAATGSFTLPHPDAVIEPTSITVKGRFLTPSTVRGTISSRECAVRPVAFTARRTG